MKKNIAILIMTIFQSTGCVSSSGISLEPSATPPKLISDNTSNYRTGWYTNSKVQKVQWDDNAKFGTVPSSLQAQGNQQCQLAGFNRAIGYHPNAIGLNNEVISGGGFLCDGYRNT